MLRAKGSKSIICDNFRKKGIDDIKNKISSESYYEIEALIKEYVKNKTIPIYADRISYGKWEEQAFVKLKEKFASEPGKYFGDIVFETLMNDKNSLWEVHRDFKQNSLVYKLIPGEIKNVLEIEKCFKEFHNKAIEENMELNQFIKNFLGNSECMNEVIVNNQEGIPPVKTFYDKYLSANNIETTDVERQAIGKLFAAIFKDILGYEIINEKCQVDDSDIKTAALYGKKDNAVIAVF